MVSPTSLPTRKTTAGAASGIVIGAPLSVVLLYVFQSIAHITLPNEVAVALGSLISVACSFAASYIVAPSFSDVPIQGPAPTPVIAKK